MPSGLTRKKTSWAKPHHRLQALSFWPHCPRLAPNATEKSLACVHGVYIEVYALVIFPAEGFMPVRWLSGRSAHNMLQPLSAATS